MYMYSYRKSNLFCILHESYFFLQTFLNGKFFIEYNHRIPISTITHLCVGGDCLFYEPEFQWYYVH